MPDGVFVMVTGVLDEAPMATLEAARNLCGIAGAGSTEFGETSEPVVGLMTEWMKGNELESRRQGGDLLVVEDRLLARGLLALLGQGHAAGADLEVDGRGTDADQRRAELVAVAHGGHALAVLAVAERAAGEEELLALGDLLGLARLRVSLGGGEGRVEGATDQEAQQQHDETRKRSPTVPGETTSGSVEQTHDESLPVAVRC